MKVGDVLLSFVGIGVVVVCAVAPVVHPLPFDAFASLALALALWTALVAPVAQGR